MGNSLSVGKILTTSIGVIVFITRKQLFESILFVGIDPAIYHVRK